MARRTFEHGKLRILEIDDGGVIGNDGTKALRVAADHLRPMIRHFALRQANQQKSRGNKDKSFSWLISPLTKSRLTDSMMTLGFDRG